MSNIETGVPAVRLYEAWVEQKIGRKAPVEAGLYDLNSEFDALEAAGVPGDPIGRAARSFVSAMGSVSNCSASGGCR